MTDKDERCNPYSALFICNFAKKRSGLVFIRSLCFVLEAEASATLERRGDAQKNCDDVKDHPERKEKPKIALIEMLLQIALVSRRPAGRLEFLLSH